MLKLFSLTSHIAVGSVTAAEKMRLRLARGEPQATPGFQGMQHSRNLAVAGRKL
jgi:hypothetical protein